MVDAGSNDISVFRVTNGGLTFTDKVGSDGTMPISLTEFGRVVYVLNAGGAGNIAGFYLNDKGVLSPIPGSVKPLSGASNPSPEQIGFNSDGAVLIVTEKATNIIDTYVVSPSGVAGAPITHPSNGMGPYGFAFDRAGVLILSEAASNSLSSYRVFDNGSLMLMSGSIPDFGNAPCWVAVVHGKAFTSNAHGGTISSYNVLLGGKLSLNTSVAAKTKIPTLDLASSRNGKFLYALNGNNITGFRVNGATLNQVGIVSGLPASTTGLAAS